MSVLRVGREQYGTSFVSLAYGYEVWLAEVRTLNAPALTIGTPVQVVMEESVTFAGTIIRRAPFVGRGGYVVAGGGGGWRLQCKPTALRSDGGIRLETALDTLQSDVAKAAAASGGKANAETIERFADDRVLGKGWTPFTASGAELLRLFKLPWFVHSSGVTRVGYTSSAAITTAAYAVQELDAHGDNATLAIRNGQGLAALVDSIKGSISGDPLPDPFVIKTMRIIEQGKNLRVTIFR